MEKKGKYYTLFSTQAQRYTGIDYDSELEENKYVENEADLWLFNADGLDLPKRQNSLIFGIKQTFLP